MNIIILPQVLQIAALTLILIFAAAYLGDRFAVLIRKRPFKKTHWSVAIGVGGSELFILLLSWVAYWILGIWSVAWWIPIVYPGLIYGITGGCQIYQQEQKIKEDKLTSAKYKEIDDISWH